MLNDNPLAFFVTWTIYGAHLQGDLGGWRRRRQGDQPPQPLLAAWHQRRLKHNIIRLSHEQRIVVETACRKHCDHRGWSLWAVSARSNHIHVALTAVDYSGKTVRDQLKANSTRGLRERRRVFRDRPVWAVGGDWQCVNSEDDLESVIQYVTEAQHRKPV